MTDKSDTPLGADRKSPGDASRRGLESLHDGSQHDETALPVHGTEPAATPDPSERHRSGPLPNEKK